MRTAAAEACLTWEALSAGARWRLSLVTVVVTHLVTRQASPWCPRLRMRAIVAPLLYFLLCPETRYRDSPKVGEANGDWR
jgi:hypothetical protein